MSQPPSRHRQSASVGIVVVGDAAVARAAKCRRVRANALRAAEAVQDDPAPRCSAAAGSAAPMMSAAFVGSATRERELERRAITTVSSSSARVEMPPGAGPAGAVLNATVGSLAAATMNATPPYFGRSE